MSDTRNKSNKKAVAYEVVQVENNKLKLIEGRYALSKEELDKLDNMIITVGGTYKIEKDPQTGKILRMENGKNLKDMNQDKYNRLIKEQLRKEQKGEQR